MQQSASQQVNNLLNQLNQTLLRKHVIDTEAKALEEQILAMRNTLAGLELGKKLQAEVAAEAAAKTAPTPPTT